MIVMASLRSLLVAGFCSALIMVPVAHAQDMQVPVPPAPGSTQPQAVAPTDPLASPPSSDPAAPDPSLLGNGTGVATDGLAPEQLVLLQVKEEMEKELDRLDKIEKGVPSIFFTKPEQTQLARAIEAYESVIAGKSTTTTDMQTFNYIRDLTLGGIVFKGSDDWIVWLNSQRLIPSRLPSEVQEIHVYKDYIEMKWLDRQNNKVVPVRLRPNQRFNLDSRTFLPS